MARRNKAPIAKQGPRPTHSSPVLSVEGCNLVYLANTKRAIAYRGWSTLHTTLLLASEFAHRAQQETDSVVVAALWSAAVIYYGRCFTKGAEGQPTLEERDHLKSLDSRLLSRHRDLMDFRNQSLAHAGSWAGDRDSVHVVLSAPPSPPAIVTIAAAHTWSRRPTQNDIDDLLSIVGSLAVVTNEARLDAHRSLKAELEAMDIDALYAGAQVLAT